MPSTQGPAQFPRFFVCDGTQAREVALLCLISEQRLCGSIHCLHSIVWLRVTAARGRATYPVSLYRAEEPAAVDQVFFEQLA